MSIVINQIKCGVDVKHDDVIEKALKTIGANRSNVLNAGVHKTSLDARRRNDIHFVHSVIVSLDDVNLEKRLCAKNKNCVLVESKKLEPVINRAKDSGKICIAGFGPAGIFCALVLAEYGYKPVVLERGEEIDNRAQSVSAYWNGGELNVQSNVQFGEGGAGTFSDGKLTTRIKDPLCQYVLDKFVEFGAPSEILVKAKPHIGTDNLRGVVKAMRERIIELGGEVRFNSLVDDFDAVNGEIRSISVNGNSEECSALVLATGHSARDTFELLAKKGVFLEPKPFSVGARIEHKQCDVDRSLYQENAGNPLLPKGEYQLSYRNKTGRAAYTFCMCPGGMVVPSASEDETIVTNGMSEFSRDGENANSALVVSVSPSDYGDKPLDGLNFARSIERQAYKISGGEKAPATTVGGFLSGKPSLDTKINPTYQRGVTPCEFRDILPKFVTDMMQEGLADFARKMKCFGDMDGVLTAPETRTSSPVRVTRGDNCNSISVSNLYPCGEGAGYAGGIMSAAVDGIKVALKLMQG